MAEVAAKAGISIGSLYQYFPDKAAIIRTLAERINAEGRACIEEGLRDVRDAAGLRDAFGRLIDTYYGLFLAEPVMRDIWSGLQADKGLREIDLEDSRINGRVLAEVLARIDPGADPAGQFTRAFLVMQLGEATMRLAISVGRDAGRRAGRGLQAHGAARTGGGEGLTTSGGGAGGRGRTDTLSPELDFESSASANSATPARGRIIGGGGPRQRNCAAAQDAAPAVGRARPVFTASNTKWVSKRLMFGSVMNSRSTTSRQVRMPVTARITR